MTAHSPDCLPRCTSRIILRRLAPADLAAFQSYRHDPQVGLYQGWTPWPDSQAADFLDEMQAAALFQPGVWFQIGIAERATRLLIGDIGMSVARNGEEALIGYTLRAQSQGRGLASEAVREAVRLLFESTAVSRVVGITDARNLPSIRLLERIGMQKVETLNTEFRGEPCVEYVFARARAALE